MAAKLHVDSLSTKTSIKKLKNALENLSTNLNVLYDEAILRIEEQNSDYRILAEKALRWVAYTYRPLKVEALQEALAIELEDLDIDVEAIQPIGLILDVCAGLLAFDEENKMVRLVHYTAQDYFDNLASSKFDDAHVLIAKECLVYLNYGIFQNSQPSTDDEPCFFHLFHYATTFWAQHAMGKRDLTLGLLEVHQFLARHPRVHLQSPSEYDRKPDALHVSLLSYYWNTMNNRHGCEIAAFYGLNDELEIFCEEIEGSQAPTHYLNSSLHLAVSNDQYNATEIVLDHGAVIDNTGGWGRTALHEAAELGHLDLVKLLLARGADIDARDRDGKTPLLRAAYDDCITALINSGADIHIKDNKNKTILHCACENGQLNIVNILLAHNMNPDERDELGETPLMYAVRYSHTACVLALLDHGANPDIQDRFGLTVLHKAALHGKLNALNILLARGAKTKVRDELGQTPMLKAAQHCETDCILALIDSGAVMNVQDDDGVTPLHLASATGSIEVMVELLKHDAAVDTRTKWMYCVKRKSPIWFPPIRFVLAFFNLNEGYRIDVCSAFRFNSTWTLEHLLLYREEVHEILFWEDGLTALDIAMLREDEEMIRMLKALTPTTGEPLTVSVEAFLLERLKVTSIEEAEDELDRRINAKYEAEKIERAAARAKARAEEEAEQKTSGSTKEEAGDEAEDQVQEQAEREGGKEGSS